ncbi:MAG: (Fe-S)-binding protein [Bacteroidales bacterium]
MHTVSTQPLYDPFVLLFTAGFTFTGVWFIIKIISWLVGLSLDDRRLVLRGILSVKTWQAVVEVVQESLLHRKIFKSGFRLGYMHMSLAFGWFMLILIGNVESTYYTGLMFKPIYVSVFWRFFDAGPSFPQAVWTPGFAFWMDLFLLLVLSGLTLAIIKRFKPRVVGMRRTTRHRLPDRLAILSLWMIFPIRLLAESATCGASGTGSFLTGSLGNLMASFLPVESLVLPSWWAYSLVLGIFFFSLPFTRYTHIPAEAVLIFLRRYGVRLVPESPGYTDLSLRSCSSCGICIDACQISQADPLLPVQSTYFVRSMRYGIGLNGTEWACLQCGRCEQSCPVGLELMPLRRLKRTDTGIGTGDGVTRPVKTNGSSGRVLYFAGCMTHLTPGVIRAMKTIFEAAGASWRFFDADGQSCCGRPLRLAGQAEGAARLRDQLQREFLAAGANLLVTSCPICYRIFKEEYRLPGMRVLHHSLYINELIEWKRIRVEQQQGAATWHEPCELGRGCGVTAEPHRVLEALYRIDATPEIDGLCCGGSLGAPGLDPATRKAVARGAAEQLTIHRPDALLTGCPMCKKSFTPVSTVPVIDIAEATAAALVREHPDHPRIKEREPSIAFRNS